MIAWKQVLYPVHALNWKFIISPPEIISIGDGPYSHYGLEMKGCQAIIWTNND